MYYVLAVAAGIAVGVVLDELYAQRIVAGVKHELADLKTQLFHLLSLLENKLK